MLHAKFRGNRSIGSEERFLKGFYHNMGVGRGDHLGHVTWSGPFIQTLVPPSQGGST